MNSLFAILIALSGPTQVPENTKLEAAINCSCTPSELVPAPAPSAKRFKLGKEIKAQSNEKRAAITIWSAGPRG